MNILELVAPKAGPGFEDREIEFTQGSQLFRFRKLLGAEMEILFGNVKKDAPVRGMRERMVSKSVSALVEDPNGGGEPVEIRITEKEAGQLPNEVLTALFDAAIDINGVRSEKKSDREDESDSGSF